MPTLSDYIERYLRRLIEESGEMVEIKRAELATQFRCVPSQINYVLQTRFTPERGYVIESRRGGGGYIRIIRLSDGPRTRFLRGLLADLDESLTVQEARGYLQRMREAGILTRREQRLMSIALGVDRGSLTKVSDSRRAAMMYRMLSVISSLPRE
ncbi:MAG: CtsR family transcriptional regulator [Bacillota bacterium]